ncbi:MAG: hypothetical protein LPK03_13735 [Pontibacter sp.]|nr:hypothetical protein [Pontibacter sp.]
MEADKQDIQDLKTILSQEQDELLDLYLERLDVFMDELKQSEKTEVTIETLHLKRILYRKSSS